MSKKVAKLVFTVPETHNFIGGVIEATSIDLSLGTVKGYINRYEADGTPLRSDPFALILSNNDRKAILQRIVEAAQAAGQLPAGTIIYEEP